jgi:predicted GNAT family N-acyltransferase
VTEIRVAERPDEVAAALDLRRAVFCGEQGVTLEEDLDGLDDDAVHVVAIEDGAVVGTCRLVAGDEPGVAVLGRMAVAPSARGRGLAGALLEAAERASGARRIVLAAQLDARGVYERAGYAAHGDVFLDARLEHVMMSKELRPREAAGRE